MPSKVQTWSNASHKPGGGNVKIENRKFDYSKVQAKVNTNKKTATTIRR
jgi:hypothetical protein